MRALVVETLAPDYGGCVLKDIPAPEPGPGEVRVKVRAASVNSRASHTVWVSGFSTYTCLPARMARMAAGAW